MWSRVTNSVTADRSQDVDEDQNAKTESPASVERMRKVYLRPALSFGVSYNESCYVWELCITLSLLHLLCFRHGPS
eukprot:5481195-Pleurochrysis_carterae.AAC.1